MTESHVITNRIMNNTTQLRVQLRHFNYAIYTCSKTVLQDTMSGSFMKLPVATQQLYVPHADTHTHTIHTHTHTHKHTLSLLSLSLSLFLSLSQHNVLGLGCVLGLGTVCSWPCYNGLPLLRAFVPSGLSEALVHSLGLGEPLVTCSFGLGRLVLLGYGTSCLIGCMLSEVVLCHLGL